MDTKGLQKEFISWCKANKKSPKSEQETKQLFVSFMKEKHPEEYKAAMENQKKQQQQQAQKAAHGAKLQYFKSLNHRCAEDEEVVYYKKGGSVTCGCKKKEQGGEVPTAKCGSAVEKFKAARKAQKGDTLARIADATGSQGGFRKAQKAKEEAKKEDKKKDFENKWKKNQVVVGKDLKKGNNNVTKKEREDVTKDKKGSKINKNCGGSAIAKFKAARCGSKLKKHQEGGSLKGIPFIIKKED